MATYQCKLCWPVYFCYWFPYCNLSNSISFLVCFAAVKEFAFNFILARLLLSHQYIFWWYIYMISFLNNFRNNEERGRKFCIPEVSIYTLHSNRSLPSISKNSTFREWWDLHCCSLNFSASFSSIRTPNLHNLEC